MTQIGEGVAISVPPSVTEAHSIAVRLVPFPEKTPLSVTWWPERRCSYGGVLFGATLTNSSPTDGLGGNGSVFFSNIPAGNCEFMFPGFYDDIEESLKSLTCNPSP